MANTWRLRLIKPEISIDRAVRAAWTLALGDLKDWIAKDLVRAMVFGGLGIGGISSTPFYEFISSNEGLSELGIGKAQPPQLLRAYERSFKVVANNSMLVLFFGDVAKLKMATPHPAAGQGLQIQSWLEFIVDDIKVNRGFVPRSELPRGTRGKIRLRAPLGGLMLPKGRFGSTGSWSFPEQFQDYDVKWLQDNVSKIESAITDQMMVFLRKRLK